MKNKHKTPLPLPLQAVREFEKAHVHCWESVEYMREGKKTKQLDWNDLCYIPIGASIAILQNLNDDNPVENAALLSALAGWRVYKEIYRFVPELRDLLFEQADENIVVPVEAIKQMPYPNIYIDISDEKEESGFFVFIDDNEDSSLELRFYGIERENGQIVNKKNLYLHLREGWTISDGIDDAMKQIKKNNSKIDFRKYGDKIQNALLYFIRIYIQLVLYICAENADIAEVKEPKSIIRHDTITNPKDTYREIQHWDVGTKIAKIIRKSKEDEKEQIPRTSSGKHNSPRPHTRRGHWHHYWIGSRKDPINRKLIIKWVAPTFVSGENVIVTENILQGDN